LTLCQRPPGLGPTRPLACRHPSGIALRATGRPRCRGSQQRPRHRSPHASRVASRRAAGRSLAKTSISRTALRASASASSDSCDMCCEEIAMNEFRTGSGRNRRRRPSLHKRDERRRRPSGNRLLKVQRKSAEAFISGIRPQAPATSRNEASKASFGRHASRVAQSATGRVTPPKLSASFAAASGARSLAPDQFSERSASHARWENAIRIATRNEGTQIRGGLSTPAPKRAVVPPRVREGEADGDEANNARCANEVV
jgi:hypothetical protein